MHINHSLDIRQDSCPLTFVKTKLLLEKMILGERAQILLSNGEAVQSLPVAVKEIGGKMVNLEETLQGFILIIEKIKE